MRAMDALIAKSNAEVQKKSDAIKANTLMARGRMLLRNEAASAGGLISQCSRSPVGDVTTYDLCMRQ
jgi:hypothetical protein